MSLPLVRQLRQDSKYLNGLFSDDLDGRRAYDKFVLGVTQEMIGQKLKNGKRFDANSTIGLYELVFEIDRRIVNQAVEQSYLRKSFVNFPGEEIFDQYQGIDPSRQTYEPILFGATGVDTTSANASTYIKSATGPNEMKTIRALTSLIRRDVKSFTEGFEVTLDDLELSSYISLPLQDKLTERVARDLMMQEQYFAFNYQSAVSSAPESQGLFYNTAISNSITWTAGSILGPSISGRAIVDMFVRIESQIAAATKGVFAGMGQPLCILTSLPISIALKRTYSDLEGRSALSYLTEHGYRVCGLPVFSDDVAYFYYKNFENIEISTSRLVEARPQSYSAKDMTWTFPFRIVTAGLTVKRPEAVYRVTGLATG